MKYLILLAIILLPLSAVAEKTQKQMPKKELIEVLKSIQNTISACESKYTYAMQSINLNRILGNNRKNDEEFMKAMDERTACAGDASLKIENNQDYIIKQLQLMKQRDSGVDFIVQAKTTLNAIGIENKYLDENSKLTALIDRITLKLTISK
jgi:hypothetical protein